MQKSSTDPQKLGTFVVAWFSLSTLCLLWDCAFVFLRPDSFPDGKLAYLFPQYQVYLTIDKSYLNLNDPFTPAQYVMTLCEIAIALMYILPNGLWIAFPTLIAIYCGKKLLLPHHCGTQQQISLHPMKQHSGAH